MNRRIVPEFILRKALKKEFSGKFTAWVMQIDLQDFSLLSNRIMKDSNRSVEQLSEIINGIFAPAIDCIYRNGGFISRFAGDAFVAMFPIEGDSSGRACLSAACGVRKLVKESSRVQISSRIGISRGTVSWQILDLSQRNLYWFSGACIQEAIVLQESAASDQIVLLSSKLCKKDRENLIYHEEAGGRILLEEVRNPQPLGRLLRCSLSQRAFVLDDLLDGVSEGEFRDVVSVFINFRGVDPRALYMVVDLAEKYGAYFNKVFNSSQGLIALVLFGAPCSYEDISQRAFRFVHELRMRQPRKSFRVGMSMGLNYAGFIGSPRRCEYTALGLSVNLASRLCMLARPGDLCFEESLLSHGSANISYTALGAHTIKGFQEQVNCYKLENLIEELQRNYFSPFIGRDAEMKRLVELLPGKADHDGLSLIYVHGDPGIGKSRLLYEYCQIMGEESSSFTLQCDAIQRSSLQPFVLLVKKLFNGLKSGSLEQRRQNFRRRYADMGKVLEEYLDDDQKRQLARMESVLAGIISLDWEGSLFREMSGPYKAEAIRESITRLFEFYSIAKPIILIVEDIQWIDAESRLILEHLLSALKHCRIQVICSARYHDDGSTHNLNHGLPCNELHLKQLSNVQIKELASALFKQAVSESLAGYLKEKTQGNLLHLEHICAYLQEKQMLESVDGFLHIKDAGIQLSSGIKAMLTARIDRLDKGMKDALQAASVLGNEFTAEVLQELLMRSQAFHKELANPAEILENGRKIKLWNVLNEVSYSFSHGLLRDTAYDMQLGKHLKELHLMAGEIMVDYWQGDRSKYAEIAGQFEKAQHYQQAADYYYLAGIWARDLYQENESLEYFNRAIDISRIHLKGKNKPGHVKYLSEIGLLYYCFGKYDLAMGNLKQAEKLCISCSKPETDLLSSCLGNIATVHKTMGEYDAALANLERALDILQKGKSERLNFVATCYCNMGECYYAKADYEKAAEVYNTALAMRKSFFGDTHQVVADTQINLAALYTDMRKLEEAKAFIDQAMEMYKKETEPNYLARAVLYANAGRTYVEMGITEQGMAYNYEALRLGKEGLGPKHPDTMLTQFNIAQICLDNEENDKALELLLEVREAWQESFGEKHPWIALCENSIGRLKVIAGDPKAGLEICQKALNTLHEVHGPDHPWCSSFEENIQYAKKELGI